MERLMINNEKLIQEISKRKCLWDQKSVEYLNRQLKVKEWETVARELNCAVYEVKTRWKLLKDSFNREIRNMSKNCTASSKWAYFEQMSFLLKGSNSLLLPTAYLSQSMVELDGENASSGIFDNELSENSLNVPEEENEVDSSPKKKLKTNQVHSRNSLNASLSQTDSQTEWTAVSAYKHEHANEDYYFLMSLLPTFERMSARQKMLVKIKMMQDVYEAAFGDSASDVNQNQLNEVVEYNSLDAVSSGS